MKTLDLLESFFWQERNWLGFCKREERETHDQIYRDKNSLCRKAFTSSEDYESHFEDKD